jgi:hypothetical protein
MKAPHLVPDLSTIELSLDKGDERSWNATVASVLDAGLVLKGLQGEDTPKLESGTQVKLIASLGDDIQQARGVVAGSSTAGVAIELRKGWGPVERRGFPRAMACVPMRYRVIDAKTAAQVAAAIDSRITDRSASRPSELPFDRSETAQLHNRLQKIERSLELLTDLVLWAGTSRSPLTERELVLSATGISFTPDEADAITEGTMLEVELLLPLRDPMRVRALGKVVRLVRQGGQSGRAAIKFETIDESDRDEISRYVFQLQRRRQALTRR